MALPRRTDVGGEAAHCADGAVRAREWAVAGHAMKREITTPAPTADIHHLPRNFAFPPYRNMALGLTAHWLLGKRRGIGHGYGRGADEGREYRQWSGQRQFSLHGRVQSWCWQTGVWPPERVPTNFYARRDSTLNASLPISATKMIARLSSVPLLARLRHWRPPAYLVKSTSRHASFRVNKSSQRFSETPHKGSFS